jgi:peptide/nickel transport system substrate-binding protein
MMRRRTFLAASASALALPALGPALGPAIAQPARVLHFVPNVDLPVLDPIANTAAQVRNHAFLVYDTLYGLDADYVPRPQMLAGHVVEPDGLVWTLRLRDGLRFHDGAPVLARDCVASIRRWASVDGFGATLMAATEALEAPDDRTIRFRLKRPFPLLPDALGKISPNICAIMPERLASLPPTKPVPENIGSGPFRLVASERVPGSRIVYERFADYVPAEGAPGLTSGAKRVELDRVEWLIMPEPASAAAALQTGAVDWLEAPPPDLLPMLRRSPNLTVTLNDTTGVVPILRFNSLYPPFDNVAIRRAVLSVVRQSEFMEAFSSDPTNVRTDVGVFCPGTPMASTVGLAEALGTTTIAEARRTIEAAGYKGERVVMLEPADHPVNSVMAQVGADLFKKLGLHVDDQAMDAATMFQRRGNRQDLDHGGWSCFPSAVAGIDVLNPAVSFLARGNGKDAWYGWPDDPTLEQLRLSWFEAPTRAEQKTIADSIQRQLLQQAPYLPLGQILQPTACRTALTGILPGFAKFWSVRKG